MQNKFGFVYIWFDRKYKRYYVGCRWGHPKDGYVCSSRWMNNSFRKRPTDFKRRIIESNISSIEETFEREYYWLKQIKQEELGRRYYNHHNRFHNKPTGGWSYSDASRKRMSNSRKELFKKQPEIKQQIAEFQKSQWTEERKRKWSERTKQQWLLGIHRSNQKQYTIRQPDQTEIKIVNLDEYCRNKQLISRVLRRATKDGKDYKGYRILSVGERVR